MCFLSLLFLLRAFSGSSSNSISNDNMGKRGRRSRRNKKVTITTQPHFIHVWHCYDLQWWFACNSVLFNLTNISILMLCFVFMCLNRIKTKLKKNVSFIFNREHHHLQNMMICQMAGKVLSMLQQIKADHLPRMKVRLDVMTKKILEAKCTIQVPILLSHHSQHQQLPKMMRADMNLKPVMIGLLQHVRITKNQTRTGWKNALILSF